MPVAAVVVATCFFAVSGVIHFILVIGCFIRRLYGCYEYINHGLINIALVDLTGGISEDIQMQGGKSLDELAKYLLSLKRMNTLMGGAIFVSIMLMNHDVDIIVH